MRLIVYFIYFFVFLIIPSIDAATSCDANDGMYRNTVIQDNHAASAYQDMPLVGICIEQDMTQAHPKRSFLKAYFDNLKKYGRSYKSYGLKAILSDLSSVSVCIAVLASICYVFYLPLKWQYDESMMPLSPFDLTYRDWGKIEKSPHMVVRKEGRDVISHLMATDCALMKDIFLLAGDFMNNQPIPYERVYGIHNKTNNFFISHKRNYIIQQMQTVWTRICFDSNHEVGYSIETRSNNRLIPFDQHDTIFNPNCVGAAIILAKWPFQVDYKQSLGHRVNFDIKVIHPYHCLDETHDEMMLTTGRRLLQNQQASTEDRALQKVSDDFKSKTALQSILKTMVMAMNNKTCPDKQLQDTFSAQVFDLREIIPYLKTDYVRFKVWYRPDYSARHVVAESLDEPRHQDGSGCDFTTFIDLEGADAVIDLGRSHYWFLATHHFMPTVTPEQTVTRTLPITQSESISLPVKWTVTIPTDILSNVSYKWTEIVANGTAGSPSPRWGHATGRLGKDEIFVGFGSDKNMVLADKHAYNITSNSWRTLYIYTSAKTNCGVYIDADSTWIFGGTDSNITQFTADTYQNIDTNIMSGKSLQYPALFLSNDRFYIFGGYDSVNNTYFNTLYFANASLSQFLNITPAISPSPRWFPHFYLIDDKAWMYGGRDNTQYYNDIWTLNLTTQQWKKIWTIPDPIYGYPIDTDTISGIIGHILVLFGPNYANGLWALDTRLQSWSCVMADYQSGSPLMRSTGSQFVSFGHDLYFFGGGIDNIYFFNDLWRLRQTTLTLLSIDISPNPIAFSQPFNLSWVVNTTNGTHQATVLLDNTTYTQVFNTPTGWMLLNMSNLDYDFSLTLIVRDFFDDKAMVRQVIPFYRV